MSTFADLPIGTVFEFDHVGFIFHRDLAHGPWRKQSPRTYVYADNRNVQHFRVGTTRTRVRANQDCGGS